MRLLPRQLPVPAAFVVLPPQQFQLHFQVPNLAQPSIGKPTSDSQVNGDNGCHTESSGPQNFQFQSTSLVGWVTHPTSAEASDEFIAASSSGAGNLLGNTSLLQ